MAVHPLRPAIHHRLGEPLPHQLANRTQVHLSATARGHLSPFFYKGTYAVLTLISQGYPSLKGRSSRVTHPFAALLISEETFSLDLHVLSTPPTFILSQDQTLHHKIFCDILKLTKNPKLGNFYYQISYEISKINLSSHSKGNQTLEPEKLSYNK